jgi:hypothetical protein
VKLLIFKPSNPVNWGNYRHAHAFLNADSFPLEGETRSQAKTNSIVCITVVFGSPRCIMDSGRVPQQSE